MGKESKTVVYNLYKSCILCYRYVKYWVDNKTVMTTNTNKLEHVRTA